jgi:hypothetical protein
MVTLDNELYPVTVHNKLSILIIKIFHSPTDALFIGPEKLNFPVKLKLNEFKF